jgi:hypothetical protein
VSKQKKPNAKSNRMQQNMLVSKKNYLKYKKLLLTKLKLTIECLIEDLPKMQFIYNKMCRRTFSN